MNSIILIVVCIISGCVATGNEFSIKESLEASSRSISFDVLPTELVEHLENAFDSDEIDDGISVVVNEYADKIFDNLRKYIDNHGLNDLLLPDETLKLKPSGHIDLYTGHFEGLNTVDRRENVVVKYSTNTKKLLLLLPIKFDELKFSYDYHTKALFLSIHGGVHGSVTDTSVNVELSFDFNSHTAFLDHYDMKDSGKVNVKFTGNKAVDWLTNAMLKAVTTLLGQVVVNVIAKVVRITLRDLIDVINGNIN